MSSLPSSTVPERKPIPAWYRERARLLNKFCKRVEEAVQRGDKPTAAIRRRLGYYEGRQYKSCPTRHLRLSFSRAWALFYQWRRQGRSPGVFELRWRNPRRPGVTAQALRSLVWICEQSDVDCFAAACRRVRKQAPFSAGQFRRALAPWDRWELTELLRERRDLQRRFAVLVSKIVRKA